jgi:F-type H+-transporting ATPase subunit b
MHPNWWTIGLQSVNFGILVWLLRRFLYRPVLSMIDARKAEVARQFEHVKAAEDLAKSKLTAAEAERAGIATEREAALKAAAAQAQEMAQARRAQAERDAQALMDSTRKALGAERAAALEEARRLALDLGADFARSLLAEVPMQYRAEAWIERMEQHLLALGVPERDALARQLDGALPLRVVTAGVLPAASAEHWRERLLRSLGVSAGVAFEVDPQLIAGAELHFPTAILRFSWQSALDAARAEIDARAPAR